MQSNCFVHGCKCIRQLLDVFYSQPLVLCIGILAYDLLYFLSNDVDMFRVSCQLVEQPGQRLSSSVTSGNDLWDKVNTVQQMSTRDLTYEVENDDEQVIGVLGVLHEEAE